MLKPADRPLNILKKREEACVLKKDRNALRSPFGEVDIPNAQVEQDDFAQSITSKVGYLSGRGVLIFRSIEIGCLNYRLPSASLVEGGDL